MKQGNRIPLICCAALLGGACLMAAPQIALTDDSCTQYSDTFETINPDKWQEALLYSRTPGKVLLRNGQLVLDAPPASSCEIQLYALFSFLDDFDIQLDYDLSSFKTVDNCTFNAGLVLQSPQDEISYKCYVSGKERTGLIFRSRLDRYGETKIEGKRLQEAPLHAKLRVTRQAGVISFFAGEPDKWHHLYTFTMKSFDPLRLRIKLQTWVDEGSPGTCKEPHIVFDSFKINACQTIVGD